MPTISKSNDILIHKFVIPGLAMNRHEFPMVPGVHVVNNPEMGDGVVFDFDYRLEDAAQAHVETLSALTVDPIKPLVLTGMSMGAMILSIMATRYRSSLPPNAIFQYLVTSPNDKQLPAVPKEVFENWKKIRLGDVASFQRLLHPFFSDHFRNTQPEIVEHYVQYRATGKNGQRAMSFMRQLSALSHFRGSEVFPNLASEETTFVYGANDRILGPQHQASIRAFCPKAEHVVLENTGHMINLERPEWFH